MRAIIVRHGDTFRHDEEPRRIGARTDLPLVESGRAQAQRLAASFAGMAIDACLTSSLRRTRETAAIVAPGLRARPTDWLREIDHGPDEGLPETAVRARIGAAALLAWETRAVAPTDWIVDAAARLKAWQTFFATAHGTILLVTSNGAARFALLALGMPPAKLRTGAYGEIVDGRLIAWDVRPDEQSRC
ncbi:histidine phosphatase family protein [Sphingomonas sp. NBWT7]|uniref:histidine phosphatase family protein n=1 Tax=Sphingomonas sp. NBWT7 TaxID=2596913 RepID=UPI0016253579|nr:histidine phosphatase family protein [Sphingomonas sp. NBWT7]QNE31313.1 histidine phosphatase family protein [Sphingomonas sp. NBWT7]